MKRALSVAMVTALTLLTFLFVAHAQEVGASSIPQKLEQEITAMETAFGSVQSFMAELITEVKTNMSDIETFNAKVKDLVDVVSAVSVEIKQAEGKIIGLRTDVDALGAGHEQLKARVDALEGGLTELAAFCDLLKARLDVQECRPRPAARRVRRLGGLVRCPHGRLHGVQGRCGDGDRRAGDGVRRVLRRTPHGDLRGHGCASERTLRGDRRRARETLGQPRDARVDVHRRLHAAGVAVRRAGDAASRRSKTRMWARSRGRSSISSVRWPRWRSRSTTTAPSWRDSTRPSPPCPTDMATTKDGILQANRELLGQYDVRLQAVEDNAAYLKTQIDTLYFISIVGLLAGVGALIWGFLGTGS